MFLNFQDVFKYKSVISIERKYNIIRLKIYAEQNKCSEKYP